MDGFYRTPPVYCCTFIPVVRVLLLYFCIRPHFFCSPSTLLPPKKKLLHMWFLYAVGVLMCFALFVLRIQTHFTRQNLRRLNELLLIIIFSCRNSLNLTAFCVFIWWVYVFIYRIDINELPHRVDHVFPRMRVLSWYSGGEFIPYINISTTAGPKAPRSTTPTLMQLTQWCVQPAWLWGMYSIV